MSLNCVDPLALVSKYYEVSGRLFYALKCISYAGDSYNKCKDSSHGGSRLRQMTVYNYAYTEIYSYIYSEYNIHIRMHTLQITGALATLENIHEDNGR